jgi:DNA-binding CsgD family transcriptional regulator
MVRASSTLIELTEAVYDLETEDAAWIPNLLRVGLPLLDRGLGVAAAAYTLNPNAPDFVVHQKFSCGGPPDLVARVDRVAGEWPREVYAKLMQPGIVATLSELTKDHPEVLEAYGRHVAGCRDVLGMTAVDPNGLERDVWKMLGAHLAAGHRLRRAVVAGQEPRDLPHNAEAVIDPTRLKLTDATGAAENKDAAKALRDAAVQIDHARGKLRKSDPAAAIEMWKSLTDGRWSLVDWFDSDRRRFVLALPNTPKVVDPRGLSERESLVATYAVQGDSGKLIGYRLGISKSLVSTALKGAMRKLGVKTRAQLVERFRGFDELT